MRYASRFFLYAPFAGLLVLAAIAATNWWLTAGAVAKHLDAANGHEIMPGVRMNFSARQLGGFPFRVDVTLKNLRLELGDVDGPVVWTTENFAAHALTYGRVQAILEAAGRQTLSWWDAQGGPHRFSFLPGTFRASALLQNGKLARFDSEIADLDGSDFRARNAQLHLRSVKDRIDVYLRLQDAHVNGGYAASLGPDISSLVANATVDKGVLLEKALRGQQPFNSALEAWRDNGGTIAIHDVAFSRSGQTMHFSGNIAVDANHDLSGTINAGGLPLRFEGNRLKLGSDLPRP